MFRQLFRIEIDESRIYGLDVLRAISIFFVVLGHAIYLAPKSTHSIHKWLTVDGVLFFFVLSGYLIGGILIRSFEDHVSVKQMLNFWKRRWFRTLPTYYLVLSVIVIIYYLQKDRLYADNYIFSHFLFLQNFLISSKSIFSVAWSLSVEEWFYILMPVVFLFLKKLLGFNSKLSFLCTIILFIFIPLFLRMIRYDQLASMGNYDWDHQFRKSVLLRLDSIIFGVLGAYFNHYQKSIWSYKSKFLMIIGIVGIVSIHVLEFIYLPDFLIYKSIFSFTLKSVFTLMLLPYLSQWKNGRGVIYKFVTIVSVVSYSLYLLHYSIVQELIIQNLSITNDSSIINNSFIVIKYFSYWIISYLLSVLLFKYFELPMTKLRDYF